VNKFAVTRKVNESVISPGHVLLHRSSSALFVSSHVWFAVQTGALASLPQVPLAPFNTLPVASFEPVVKAAGFVQRALISVDVTRSSQCEFCGHVTFALHKQPSTSVFIVEPSVCVHAVGSTVVGATVVVQRSPTVIVDAVLQ
jgi:hypothetical protein